MRPPRPAHSEQHQQSGEQVAPGGYAEGMQAPAAAPWRKSGAPACSENTRRNASAEPGGRTDRALEGETRPPPPAGRPRVLKAAFPMQPKGGCTGRMDRRGLIFRSPARRALDLSVGVHGAPAAPRKRPDRGCAIAQPQGPAQRVRRWACPKNQQRKHEGITLHSNEKKKGDFPERKPPFPYPNTIGHYCAACNNRAALA